MLHAMAIERHLQSGNLAQFWTTEKGNHNNITRL